MLYHSPRSPSILMTNLSVVEAPFVWSFAAELFDVSPAGGTFRLNTSFDVPLVRRAGPREGPARALRWSRRPTPSDDAARRGFSWLPGLVVASVAPCRSLLAPLAAPLVRQHARE